MFAFSTIAHYHTALLNGTADCMTAVNFYLHQIELHTSLNAFVEVYASEAKERAALLDEKRKAGLPIGKLHGVVIALKDVLCYKGHKVTAASAILKDFEAVYTASAVQFLLAEEAIIIGNCNCDEFAMGSTNENSVYGATLNALDQTKVPGGSSGGSAVAVQANLCMVSLGSDTGGSVRQPADFCGIVGLKPGYGIISRYGLIAYASSFDQIGIFGNNIEDVALLLEVMSKQDAYDSTLVQKNKATRSDSLLLHTTKKFRVAYFEEALNHASLDKEIAGAIFEKIGELKKAGHVVEAIPFDLLDYIVPAYYVLTTAEASSNLSRYDGIRYGHQSKLPAKDLTSFYLQNRSEGFGKEVKRRIMLGTFVLSTGYYDAYYNKAQQVRKLLCDHIALVFKNYDLLLLPTSTSTAFYLGDKDKDPIAMYLSDIFTVFANLTAIPGIALPLFVHSNGMPFGLQVMANRNDELTLLHFSQQLMQQKQTVAAS